MSITSFLNSKGFYSFEGNSQQIPEQIEDLIRLTNKPNINVMEIGFNAGHSADVFLHHNKSLTLTSFDLGAYPYVPVAKEYIDTTYPNRHTLILGDSTTTLPIYISNHKYTTFDFIFIDGGHYYEIAKADIEHCFHLAHKDTIVAMDDTIFAKGWEQEYSIGPTKIWNEYLYQNKIIEFGRKYYPHARGMTWGKYIM